jgi:hypothetical protein
MVDIFGVGEITTKSEPHKSSLGKLLEGFSPFDLQLSIDLPNNIHRSVDRSDWYFRGHRYHISEASSTYGDDFEYGMQ